MRNIFTEWIVPAIIGLVGGAAGAIIAMHIL